MAKGSLLQSPKEKDGKHAQSQDKLIRKKKKVNANGWPVLTGGKKEKQTEAERAAVYMSRQIAALKYGRCVMSMMPMTIRHRR